MTYPVQPRDPFAVAGRALHSAANSAVLGNLPSDQSVEIPGFTATRAPSQSGIGTRQSRISNERPAVFARNMMRWFVPEMGIVEMFINPQNVTYNEKKQISEQRTKGGFVLQYWGEELGKLSITGTTGTSSIEGINVLYDVYRAEQLAFDPYALVFAAQEDEENALYGGNFGLLGDIANLGMDTVTNVFESGSPTTRPKPTLASLAFSIELYWSGWVFRGYFTDFQLVERADHLGLFDYTIHFTYTQRRGFRTNFLAWHRSPTNGPSESDPLDGPPYSYVGGMQSPTGFVARPNTLSTDQALASPLEIIGDIVGGPGIGRLVSGLG